MFTVYKESNCLTATRPEGTSYAVYQQGTSKAYYQVTIYPDNTSHSVRVSTNDMGRTVHRIMGTTPKMHKIMQAIKQFEQSN